MEMKSFVGLFPNGEVLLDRGLSHSRIKRKELAFLLKEFNEEDLSSSFVEKGVKLPPEIKGRTFVVPVCHRDEIFYQARVGKKGGLSKFVKGRTPMAAETATIIVMRSKEEPGVWFLVTAYFGSLQGPEPWEEKASPKSILFWANHAHVENYYKKVGDIEGPYKGLHTPPKTWRTP